MPLGSTRTTANIDSAVNIVANIILGLIPVTFVFKLSLTLHKKIGLTVLFSLSLM